MNFRDVTKLNCIVVPQKAQPGIKIKVTIEHEGNDTSLHGQSYSFYLITDCKLGSATASINVTSTVPSNPTYEELVTSNTNTTKFEYYISPKQYTFGPETNRAVRIHIYDFQAPLKIQV